MTTYEAIRDELETGDQVAFDPAGGKARIIPLWDQDGPWAHVGSVYRLPGIDRVMLAHAVAHSTIPDALTGKVKRGVTITPLSDEIRAHPGRVAIRRILGARDPGRIEAIHGWIRTVRTLDYPRGWVELVSARIDWFGLQKEDFSTIFCSECSAELLEQLGCMGGEIPANEFTPNNLMEEGRAFPDAARLLNGYTWAPQVDVKRR